MIITSAKRGGAAPLLLAALPLVAAAQSASPAAAGFSAERLQRVDQFIERGIASGELSGGVALLMQVEAGKVRLDDPVSKYLPSYRDMKVAVTRSARPGAQAAFARRHEIGLAWVDNLGTDTALEFQSDHAARRTLVSDGSFGWSGAYGTHFWVDPSKKLVAILMLQTPGQTRTEKFETAVMQALEE
jgi:CubicO group peptidase (beta-lactamase class C family)